MTSLHEVLVKSSLAGLAGLLVSGLSMPVLIRILKKLNSRQTISEFVPEHKDKQGTPTMGGIAVVLGLIAAIAISWSEKSIWALIIVVIYGAIGFADDFLVPKFMPGKRGLGWIPKLVLEFLPFVLLLVLNPNIGSLGIAFLAFLVLLTSNAYNFSDGIDGLAGTLGVVLSLSLAVIPLGLWLISPLHNIDLSMVPAMFGLAMALLPFLAYNVSPAKVFMGDVGSLPIGAILGYSLFSGSGFQVGQQLNFQAVWPYIPFLFVMLVEIIPVPLQIASAKLRKGKRLFPFRTPVHHAFQHAGCSEPKIVFWFVMTQIVMSLTTIFWVLLSGGSAQPGGSP